MTGISVNGAPRFQSTNLPVNETPRDPHVTKETNRTKDSVSYDFERNNGEKGHIEAKRVGDEFKIFSYDKDNPNGKEVPTQHKLTSLDQAESAILQAAPPKLELAKGSNLVNDNDIGGGGQSTFHIDDHDASTHDQKFSIGFSKDHKLQMKDEDGDVVSTFKGPDTDEAKTAWVTKSIQQQVNEENTNI